MGDLFTGTYELHIPAVPGTVMYIGQVTPTVSQPYQGYVWAFTPPDDTYDDLANEVNVLYTTGIYDAVLQCEKATGVLTLVASNPANAAEFVRFVRTP